MSADVQPRKRKDKKKKRDSLDSKSEEEIFTRKLNIKDDEEIKESHHGVHVTKMGADDVHLHIQGDHSTGGHWCAKLFFFSLLAILIGLIGLIIIENRGLSDLDTPLSESRYSEYFEGWVDEHRGAHDDHAEDKIPAELENHDAEPFEEEEDHSEIEDDDDHDDVQEHVEDTLEKNVEDEDDVEETSEDVAEEEITNDEPEGNNPNDEDDEIDDDDDDEDADAEEIDIYASDGDTFSRTKRELKDDDDEEDVDEGFDEADDDNDDKEQEELEQPLSQSPQSSPTDEQYPYEEDDDDFESLERVVDNDADEQLHLQQRAKQDQELTPSVEEQEQEEESSSQIKSRPGGGPQEYNEDDFIEEQLRRANEEMLQNNLQSGLKMFEILSLKYPDVPGALYGKAKALDRLSEELQSNQILIEAIMAYKRFLALEENIDDDLFKEAAERCIDRMRFRGLNLQAVSIHEMLIKRFENESYYRNQLTVTYLLINRLTDAKKVLKETLVRWPEDGFAQVHYGFVLKNLDKNLEKAAEFMSKGIKSQENGTQDGRFYFNLGDALQRLGRSEEAMQVYREAAEKKLFLSEYQRSLYNVDNLRAQPFWSKEQTTYGKYFDEFERNWQQIKEEGLNVLNEKGFFMDEAESLRDFGDWKQFELFARGHRNRKNCAKAPITCALLESFPAARFCKRGQTKFSVMHPRTHVWPHCGPTNCRIRAHLGLKIPSGTKIRVAKENRSWEEGKFLIFDDSFEHEVWHNGTSLRLVLIVDVWHPELTEEQRNNLSPI